MTTRCNKGFYCRSYCLLNMFRASLCPSSGAQEYYTVVAACGISCCGFSSSWSGVELRVMCPVCRMLQHIICNLFTHKYTIYILTTMHGQNHIKFLIGKSMRKVPLGISRNIMLKCIRLLTGFVWIRRESPAMSCEYVNENSGFIRRGAGRGRGCIPTYCVSASELWIHLRYFFYSSAVFSICSN